MRTVDVLPAQTVLVWRGVNSSRFPAPRSPGSSIIVLAHIEGRRMTAIRLGPPPHPPVVWHDWEPGPLIEAGRFVRHIPTGWTFAVQCPGDDPDDRTARLIDGPDGPDVAEIACMAIGYFMLPGQRLPARFP
jgi:hypothetical protein